jgi:hypothetical protein
MISLSVVATNACQEMEIIIRSTPGNRSTPGIHVARRLQEEEEEEEEENEEEEEEEEE